MKIEYYDRGAKVEFSGEEIRDCIRYDSFVFRDDSLNGLPEEERRELIRKKLVLLAVADNMYVRCGDDDRWTALDVLESTAERAGEGYEYTTGMTDGKVNKEVRITLTDKYIRGMIRYYSDLLDYYYQCGGAPVKSKAENELHLFGGTHEVSELKEYVPDDIQDARIYEVDGRYYILGRSNAPEKMEKYITEEYFVKHYRRYADSNETKKLLVRMMG